MTTLNDFLGAQTGSQAVEMQGNATAWHTMSIVRSQGESWSRVTRVMEVGNSRKNMLDNATVNDRTSRGCLVQVSTQWRGQISDALTFVPGAILEDFGLSHNGKKKP